MDGERFVGSEFCSDGRSECLDGADAGNSVVVAAVVLLLLLLSSISEH